MTRNDLIISAVRKGEETIVAIAKRFGISRMRVYQVAKCDPRLKSNTPRRHAQNNVVDLTGATDKAAGNWLQNR